MYDYNFDPVGYDTNGDGLDDIWYTSADLDGDGYEESFIKMVDYNGDGQSDSVTIHTDTNGDGQYDTVSKAYDTTGDGVPDTMKIYTDTTGNGHPDGKAQVYAYNNDSGAFEPQYITTSVGGTMHYELDNFVPTDEYPKDISGLPYESMDYWQYQGDTGRCALYSQKFVIEELTGQDINIDEFADYAESHGWFSEDGGTTFLNTNKMLDAYGINNEMEFHKDVSDIENCLNSGGKVIVGIDADQIWYGKDSDIFSPMSGANHAVEVIGVDRTDPNNPMVILNDSGSPNGKGEMIPLETFEEAWESGDCQMIECYKNDMA